MLDKLASTIVPAAADKVVATGTSTVTQEVAEQTASQVLGGESATISREAGEQLAKVADNALTLKDGILWELIPGNTKDWTFSEWVAKEVVDPSIVQKDGLFWKRVLGDPIKGTSDHLTQIFGPDLPAEAYKGTLADIVTFPFAMVASGLGYLRHWLR